MIEDFNNNEKEGINFKSLSLKIFFSLALLVICYNLFFSSNSNSANLIGVEKKEKIINEFGFVLNDYKVKRDTIQNGDSFGQI